MPYVDSEDDYVPSWSEGAELTDKDPRFYKMEVPSAEELQAMKVDELIQLYRNIRDQLATDRHGYEAREAQMKTHLQVISMNLRDRADALGVDSFKTDRGTAYRNVKESIRIQDWDSLSSWVLRTGNIQVLQKRVSPNAAKEVREQEGDLPPGTHAEMEVEFAVRSPTARRK